MNLTELKNIITPIIRWYNNHTDDDLLKNIYFCAEQIEEFLDEHPKNTEWRLKLTRLYFCTPAEDYEMCVETLEKIFKYDAYNIRATLMYAFFEDYFLGTVSEKTLARLKLTTPITCCEKSMVLLAMSWHYSHFNKKTAKSLLKRAASVCEHCIEPWFHLTYENNNQVENMICANYIARFIAKNASLISRKHDEYMISVDDFFDTWYKGYFQHDWVNRDRLFKMYGKIDFCSSVLRCASITTSYHKG